MASGRAPTSIPTSQSPVVDHRNGFLLGGGPRWTGEKHLGTKNLKKSVRFQEGQKSKRINQKSGGSNGYGEHRCFSWKIRLVCRCLLLKMFHSQIYMRKADVSAELLTYPRPLCLDATLYHWGISLLPNHKRPFSTRRWKRGS